MLPLSVLALSGCNAKLGEGVEGSDQHDPTVVSPGDGDTTQAEDFELHDPLVRRLTRDELRFTLEDSFGLTLSEEDLQQIPADRPLEGFVNVATSQTTLPEHVEAYANLAASLATRLQAAGQVATLAACSDVTAACRDSVISALGKKMFRRPIEATESTAFAGLFDAIATEEGAFDSASLAVFQAMLQSPQFLYRIENETAASRGTAAGTADPVGGYEMANRLSYLLWASAPDEELLAAAAAGQLDSVEGVRAAVEALLSDARKSERVTSRYMMDWARLEALPEDGGLKPELISSLIASYNHMIWTEGIGPRRALTHDQLIMTGSLAEGYGLEKSSEDLALYDISTLPGRVGLLTHPGLIAGMTNADGGAIVARGLFLQSQLFCQETPDPPTAVQAEIDEFIKQQPETASDRTIAETRLERKECAACHSGFDPLAYGLEQFDYQGRYRLTDEHDNELFTDGWIPGRVRTEGGDVFYMNIEEFAAALEDEPKVAECITAQHVKYALGRVVNRKQEPAVAQIAALYEATDGSYPALITAIATHPLFRTTKAE